MLPKLPSGIYFTVAPKKSGKKYIAHLPDGRTVKFGQIGYEHYKDSVPKRLGGKMWSHEDHLDKKRKANYISRHSNIINKSGKKSINVKYSPAWFSYHFLW